MSNIRHDIEHSHALRSKTKVIAEWNYNDAVFGLSRMGEALWYQAPQDPAAHPQYVDAEGRILPVDPTTLQVRINANGHVIDKNGQLVPEYERITPGGKVHIDDVRVAVASRELTATDADGEDILLAPNGVFIPVGDDGLVGTTVVDGVVYAVDGDGNPVAPLERIMALKDYRPPVSAYNFPVTQAYARVEPAEELWEEFFPINSIAERDRPERPGALIAWAMEKLYDSPLSETIDFNAGRFYPASEDRPYKYWTPSERASLAGTVPSNDNLTFNNTWTTSGMSGIVHTTGQISGDVFAEARVSKAVQWTPGSAHDISYRVVTQSPVQVQLVLHEWSSPQSTPDTTSSEYLGETALRRVQVHANVITDLSQSVTTSPNSRYQVVEFRLYRLVSNVFQSTPRVSLSNLASTSVSYAIENAGPRLIYDRPVKVNKLVVSVDPTVDPIDAGVEGVVNLPVRSALYVNVDRGDGVFTWNKIMDNPPVSPDGKIILNWNGTSWTTTDVINEAGTQIMGLHYVVWSMNRPGARLNVIEMSARYRLDLSAYLLSYNVKEETSEHNFVLPYGTVSANVGSLEFGNFDGRFNGENKYLLDVKRLAAGQVSWTTALNPLYKLTSSNVRFEVSTAVSDVNREPTEFVRMATMTAPKITVSDSRTATAEMKDASEMLQRVKPGQVFFNSADGMSVSEVICMLLDSVGFTSFDFDDTDDRWSASMKYYWTHDDQTAWECIQDICRSTQTTAYFDEFNVLHFKSLRQVYDEALHKPIKTLLTTDKVDGKIANVYELSEAEKLEINRITLDYVNLKESDVSDSGVPVMEAVWEPDGTQVLRAAPIVDRIPDKPITANDVYAKFIRLPWDSTRTWPFEGMVQIEGELIKYRGKEYYYYAANGKTRVQKYIYSEEERKELDKIYPKRAFQNVFTGRLKITERGAENTKRAYHEARSNTRVMSNEYTKFLKVAGQANRTGYTAGITVSESCLQMNNSAGWPYNSWYYVSHGHVDDYRPSFYGTRLMHTGGTVGAAGIGIGLSGDTGIFIELNTTDSVEANARKRNELTVYTKGTGQAWRTDHGGTGVAMPVSKNEWYDLDVAVASGTFKSTQYTYGQYENVQLEYGSKGNNVKVLQQALNRNRGEKLTVNGIYDMKVVEAVRRLEKANGFDENGTVAQQEWRALGSYQIDVNGLSVHVSVNGVHSGTFIIPSSSMPFGGNGGRFGVFTRGYTRAKFEYLYAFNGDENIPLDHTGILDRVKGGYISDQLFAGWFSQKRYRYLIRGGKKVKRDVVHKQLFFDDFGAIAHEVRDYDVAFNKDYPSTFSYPFFTNEMKIVCTDYTHRPFGAKFRLVNKAREDAILKGEDATIFGSEDAVDQHFLIYGRTINPEDTNTVVIEDRDAVRSRGLHELSISMPWIQTKESAQRLGSHVVDAMSQPVREWNVGVFGNPLIKVGDIVSLYAPEDGVFSTNNRYVVTSVEHSNNGGHDTRVSIRQMIPDSGYKQATAADVLNKNNNNFVLNQYLNDYEIVDGDVVMSNMMPLSNTKIDYVTTANGGGAALVKGTALAVENPGVRTVGMVPELWGLDDLGLGPGRAALTFGDHYLFTASVTANSDCSVRLSLEGFNTSGLASTVDSKTVSLKKGQKTRIVVTGQFTVNNIPEVRPTLYVLAPGNQTGGTTSHSAYVWDMFFRTSNDPQAIYPKHGYATLKRP